MEIKPGAEVIDINGEKLGTVDRLLRNLVTGEVEKFMIHRKGAEKDLFPAQADINESTEFAVKLNVSFRELEQR